MRIEHDTGLAGHSDADVALHAVVDAMLGAVGAGDIGQHFPPSDPQWRGAPSSRVRRARGRARRARPAIAIGNVDLTLICEAPKIGPHREAMRARLAELLGVDVGAVSVKATTTERLGFTGRGEGIAAQAVATLVPHRKDIDDMIRRTCLAAARRAGRCQPVAAQAAAAPACTEPRSARSRSTRCRA